MPKIGARNILFVLLAAVALIGGTYALRRARVQSRAVPRVTQPALSSHATTGAATSDAKVIRFVKDPELAPAFEVRDIAGKAVSKADWSGKVVLVNFWATWCPPCREEIPELLALQEKFKGQLEIVGISEDDDDSPAKVLKFVQQKGMNYPIVMSTPELIESFGGVPALPTSFLIDPQGRVMQKHSGLYPMDSYVLEIRALLGLPVDARIETFVDAGQVFLKNAVNATELPGVDFAGLTPEQKKLALHRLNAESCTCGCGLTLSQCRVNDSECPVSAEIAAQVVKDARSGKSGPASAPKPSNSKASL
jgi:thiol-disulfide isomerase/thioredoxin